MIRKEIDDVEIEEIVFNVIRSHVGESRLNIFDIIKNQLPEIDTGRITRSLVSFIG